MLSNLSLLREPVRNAELVIYMPASTSGKTDNPIIIPVSISQPSLTLLLTFMFPATVAGNIPIHHAPASLPLKETVQ